MKLNERLMKLNERLMKLNERLDKILRSPGFQLLDGISEVIGKPKPATGVVVIPTIIANPYGAVLLTGVAGKIMKQKFLTSLDAVDYCLKELKVDNPLLFGVHARMDRLPFWKWLKAENHPTIV